MKRNGWALLVAMLALLAAAVAMPRAAQADVGDGLLACSVGEICFKKHVDNNWESDLKHFWWNHLNHDKVNWSGPEGGKVGEAASMYWNRDTECNVDVLDYHPWPLPTLTYTMHRNGTSWYYQFPGSWNDENDGHKRCP